MGEWYGSLICIGFVPWDVNQIIIYFLKMNLKIYYDKTNFLEEWILKHNDYIWKSN